MASHNSLAAPPLEDLRHRRSLRAGARARDPAQYLTATHTWGPFPPSPLKGRRFKNGNQRGCYEGRLISSHRWIACMHAHRGAWAA